MVGAEASTPAIRVDYSDSARALMNGFEEFKYCRIVEAEGDPFLYLWGKAVENARRVALTVATYRNPVCPLVENLDAAYAIELVKQTTCDMIAACRENVGATQLERNMKTLSRIIRRHGAEGISLSELTRLTRAMKPATRNDALDNRLDGGEIDEKKRPGTGRKSVTWFVPVNSLQ